MGELARLHIGLGELTKAARIFQAMRAALHTHHGSLGGSLVECRFHYVLTMARLGIARGTPGETVSALQSLCTELDGKGMRYLATRARIVLAEALHQASDAAGAEAAIATALRYGQENGLVRSFVDEAGSGEGVLAAMIEANASGTGHASWYLDDLRKAAARQGGPSNERGWTGHRKDGIPGSLSTRERQIMECLAKGLSNKEMARILEVSPETVKWHLKNIYTKLDVTSRLQAARWARGQTVVPPEIEGDRDQSFDDR